MLITRTLSVPIDTGAAYRAQRPSPSPRLDEETAYRGGVRPPPGTAEKARTAMGFGKRRMPSTAPTTAREPKGSKGRGNVPVARAQGSTLRRLAWTTEDVPSASSTDAGVPWRLSLVLTAQLLDQGMMRRGTEATGLDSRCLSS